ncbi:MAG: HAMP domain-containing protein [Cyanobacteria bacterium SBLK]|nr:HAMP domain-containing protein [Cyanobacteria bacterium SBLK]
MLQFNRLTIKSKLSLILLAASLGSILVISLLSWNRARSHLTEAIFDQLTSLRAAKARQIESLFQTLYNHVETLAEDRMIVSAMAELNRGFREVQPEYISNEWSNTIAQHYENEFFPELAKNIEGSPHWANYAPRSQAAQYLQYHYIANNPNPVGEKDALDRAEDGSEYSKYHERYHPIFRNLIKKFGYYDLFLINHRTGDIVYSVYKETDYATNLITGPYRQSNLAKIVKAVQNNPDRGQVQIVDFQPYRPSYMEPAAFIAAPIYNGPHIVGILAIQLPVDEINNVMTNGKEWEQAGLGETGETYLVGTEDLTMRSLSRFLIEDLDEEDPEKNLQNYKQTLQGTGLPDSIIDRIEQFESSIILQPVNTEAAQRAKAGEEGTKIILDYRNIPVLSSYAPLDIPGLDWAILAEKDRAEAYQPVRALQNVMLLSTVILSLVVTWLAAIAARNFVRPINTLVEGSRQVGRGNLEVEVKLDTQDEFNLLAQTFNEMVKNLRQQTQALEQSNQEKEELLLNILPSPIAERMKQGEKSIADEVQQATVLFATATGFTNMSEQREVEEAAALLNELINAFDEQAEKYDVEKLKTIGDRYLAVSGITKPRLDHTKTMMDFIVEAMKIVQNFNNKYQTRLGLKAGIHVGPVMAGIIGSKKFMYELWGETVNIANSLNLNAQLNTVLVTKDVYDRLKEFYTFSPHDAIEIEGRRQLNTWFFQGKGLSSEEFEGGYLRTDSAETIDVDVAEQSVNPENDTVNNSRNGDRAIVKDKDGQLARYSSQKSRDFLLDLEKENQQKGFWGKLTPFGNK